MKNIVLIGMPSAGKSTVGVIVAKSRGMNFIDTDLLLQTRQKRLLQDILDTDGIDKFIAYEEAAILSIENCHNTVISTGGSAIYSEKAMSHLQQNGIIIYLHVDLNTVHKRLNNLKTRGVVLNPGQTLESVYKSRKPLYEKYSDIAIDCSNYSIDMTVEAIRERLAG